MSLRIGMTGASGTGKSRLATWLSAELGLPLNPVDFARAAESARALLASEGSR